MRVAMMIPRYANRNRAGSESGTWQARLEGDYKDARKKK